MPQLTLAAHDDYLITFHNHAKDTEGPVVITFGGQGSGISPGGFGTGWCRPRGLDSIYVAQRKATQYQGLDLETFAQAVSGAISGRDVVCYGASLGGYAALYFGAASMRGSLPPRRCSPPILHCGECRT